MQRSRFIVRTVEAPKVKKGGPEQPGGLFQITGSKEAQMQVTVTKCRPKLRSEHGKEAFG